jgi:hypothetical protein
MKQINSKATNLNELKAEIVKISKANPSKWYTFSALFGSVKIYESDNKPSDNNGAGAEQTYHDFGGFFQNGQIVKPSKTFIHKYEFIPGMQ